VTKEILHLKDKQILSIEEKKNYSLERLLTSSKRVVRKTEKLSCPGVKKTA
jgi:hypothetical protein